MKEENWMSSRHGRRVAKKVVEAVLVARETKVGGLAIEGREPKGAREGADIRNPRPEKSRKKLQLFQSER